MKTETSHTPGPWTWEGPDYDEEHQPPNQCASAGLESPDGKPVLSGCDNCSNIFYSEADGRLIAAAPALLEALREIEAGLANTGSTPGQWMTRIRKDQAHAIACSAISKAEGRNP